jgi:hypothetical protein
MSKFIRNQWESSKQYAHSSHGHDYIIMRMAIVLGWCTLVGLVPPRSPKLWLAYWKTKACWAVLNIHLASCRSHAHVRVAAHACWGGGAHIEGNSSNGDWGSGAHVRAAVLQCVVARADGEGGLWWPEPMMNAACMHVWAPRRAIVLCHQIQ